MQLTITEDGISISGQFVNNHDCWGDGKCVGFYMVIRLGREKWKGEPTSSLRNSRAGLYDIYYRLCRDLEPFQ